MPEETTLSIAVPGGNNVTAIATKPVAPNDWTLVYAPGAGSNVHDPFGRYACRALTGHGIATVRFQFPYQEAGRSRPDPPATLEATWRAVIEFARLRPGRIIVSGRSMGGRVGSIAVAGGMHADAIALFAYPLHPPGSPEKVRTEHFPRLSVPVLFCSGTRDPFGTPDELRDATATLQDATLHLLEEADHGFSVRKAGGRTREDVWAEAVTAVRSWLRKL